MEQSGPARQSSGIYDADYGSQHSFASDTELREHAAQPAGVATRTAAGIPAAATGTDAGEGATSGWADQPDAPPAQPQQPKIPLYKRRWFIITSIVVALLGIALLFIILFPVIRAIVQLVVRRSQIDIERATITNPTNSSFDLRLEGNVTHTGIFSASIKFTENIDVFWLNDPENNGTGIKLGHMGPLEELHAHDKRAKLDQIQHFVIEDQAAFSDFSRFLITAPNFSWRISSNNLRVQALKFPVAKGITFDKRIDLKGINNFQGNIVLLDFQLPRDDPAGGLDFVAVTQLTNESPFVLELGTTIFDLSYDSVLLGSGTSTNTIINTGPNNITLRGVLPVANPSDLPKISTLFTNYLNGDTSEVLARGKSTSQDDGTIIQWLSDGLQALKLDVPFKAFVPIDPIRAVDIGDMALSFTPESPWAPGISSNTVRATLQLPFGFHITIDQIQNSFDIVKDGAQVAGLSTPLGASISNVTVFGETDTRGMINITIANTTLTSSDSEHSAFSAFNANLTSSDVTEFRLIGNSSAVANLSLGVITLNPIKVNVSTSLNGLQGLNGMTQIGGVDVAGGTTEHINLNINVTIFNPSSLNLSTGDLTLQLSRDGSPIGTALLPDLVLLEGNNSFRATSEFIANSEQGQQTLNDFIGHRDVALTITGFDQSTAVASLVDAFKTLNIAVTLPAMTTNLLESAALTVLPTTGRDNNISHVAVSLNNPFNAPLHITRIISTVTSHGILLGTIDTTTDFRSPPRSVTRSPALELNMNFDPAALFTVTRLLAVEANLDTTPLDGIVQLGGIQYLLTTGPPQAGPPSANVFVDFNLPQFVQTAFRRLQSDVVLTAEISIGDYPTMIQYTQTGVPTATDDTLNFILPVLAQPIVDMIVRDSSLGLDTIMITNPQQDTFGTQLSGSIGNAGPFNAMITFPSGLDVAWQGAPLGNIQMQGIQITGGADTNPISPDVSIFNIQSVDHLTAFTQTLLRDDSFQWGISGSNLTVKALGIEVTEVPFPQKDVSLKGFDGLKGRIDIMTFNLPRDDPQGNGIELTLEAEVHNPSDVGIQLSTIGFHTFSGASMIAPVTSFNTTNLAPRKTVRIPLGGTLIHQSEAPGQEELSRIFSNFINAQNNSVEVRGMTAGPRDVTWLNTGIKALQVGTILRERGLQKIIDTITLNQVGLSFTKEKPYNPMTNSNSTNAVFQLPGGFDFSINITNISQVMDLGYKGTMFGRLNIAERPSTTDNNKTILFTFPPTSLDGSNNATFDDFLKDETMGSNTTFELKGTATAIANTRAGILTLTGIPFDVNTTIPGLQGLNTEPVTVSKVDVFRGDPLDLVITVNATFNNPSTLTISTGSVMFDLQINKTKIGTVRIADLVIRPGEMSPPTEVHYQPEGEAIAVGLQLLESFIQGINVSTAIVGSDDSTDVMSLKPALKQIEFSPVTIPAFNGTLVKNVNVSFPTNISTAGIANSNFTLTDPWTASINIDRVNVTVLYQGLTLGYIDTSGNIIHVDGHSTATSRQLDFIFNLEPKNIIMFLELAAAQNNTDLGPLKDLLQFVLDNPDFHPPVITTVGSSTSCVSGKEFPVLDAILASLKDIRVNLGIDSDVRLDQYPVAGLVFSQNSIPVFTDRTALYLIGAVAGPIAQHLVDQSELKFNEATITNITNDGFDLFLKGSLNNTGPLDALIDFTEPLVVSWEGSKIANITLPSICAFADTGVPDYEAKAHVTIIDQPKFIDFSVFLLRSEEFEWTISTENLRLTALETIFDHVSLNKTVSFKAFNNLPGVTIENFQLPHDDPEGIHIDTDVKIPSPAQLGIELGLVKFRTFFQGVFVGPLAANNLSLKPNSVTETNLTGDIVKQNDEDIKIIGILFSEYLAGDNVTLEIRGDTVQPPGADSAVDWLSTAFMQLSLNVTLPGQRFDVIKGIQLDDLKVVMENKDQEFAPPTSSEHTVGQYANPFGFQLQVVEAGESLILNFNGVDAGQLDLPVVPVNGGVSTGNVVDLIIQFKDQPLKALDHPAFGQMFAGVTLKPDLNLILKGSVNVSAKTSIGNVPITGIPINVTSSLKGIASFGGTASLSNVSVAGSGGTGGNEYILAPLTTTLDNPSHISLSTIDVSLPVVYKGTKIGRSVINNFDLVPGPNVVATEFHYEPDNANDTVAQSFLTSFIQTGDRLDLTIDGDDEGSPFEPLRPALDGVTLHTSLNGLNQPNIIASVHVIITLESLITDLVSAEFQIHNPLDTDLAIEFIQADSGVDGKTYAFFRQEFTSLVVKAGETIGSGLVRNVLLTQGATAALDIIPLGILDIHAANTIRVGGPGGYQIPWLQLNQASVPTTYDLDLGLAGARLSLSDLINEAKSIIAHNFSTSSLPTSASVASTGSVASGGATGTTSAATEGTTSADAAPTPVASAAPIPQATTEAQPQDRPEASSPAAAAETRAASSKASGAPEEPGSDSGDSEPA